MKGIFLLANQISKVSLLYFITVFWGVITFWLSPHLPLTDLPQHAGQVALLKEMLFGQSQWREIFQINLLTPYIVTYALATILSFVVSISTAFKILLSIGYLAYIYTSIRLREHFNVDRRLDWLFILPFFGFAYQYGFVSFILSAPLGLSFILLADKHAQNLSKSNTLNLFFLGLLLLATHGLMFLFSVGLGGLLLLFSTKSFKSLIYGCVPYFLVLTLFAIVFLLNVQINTELGLSDYTLQYKHQDSSLYSYLLKIVDEFPIRISQAFFYILVGSKISINPMIHIPVLIFIFLFPWLLGLKINWSNKKALLFFACLVIMFIFTPVFIFGTYFVYQRFAIFIIPSYAILFSNSMLKTDSVNLVKNPREFELNKIIITALLIFGIWIILGFKTLWGVNFKNETADIDSLLNTLEPSQKALSVIFDPFSKANNNSRSYGSYPQWYQAEHNGLVYENFAVYAPMPVRFRPGQRYSVYDSANENGFDWKKNHGDNYRYFIVRSRERELSIPINPSILFKGAPCLPKKINSQGRWTIYEQLPCK